MLYLQHGVLTVIYSKYTVTKKVTMLKILQ